MPPLVSPCEHKFLPSEKTLKSWKKQLQDIIAIASGDYFVETDNGYSSVDTINGALQLYKSCRVRKFVRQEIDYFSETFRMPSNLKIIPEKEPLQTFESIIHNNPYEFLRKFVPVLKNNNSAIMICIDINNNSRINY